MKKILAVLLVLVTVTMIFTGCTKVQVTVQEKEPTVWTTCVISNGTVITIFHHGWHYYGIDDNNVNHDWVSSADYEIGERIEILV